MKGDLYIGDVKVKTNSHGLFCVNDLHKAAGSLDKHRPSEFMRREHVIDLVKEIVNCGSEPHLVQNTTAGRYGGTFVCKELVYAYAMFVSAEFNLKVIRAYDDFHKGISDANALVDDVKAQGRTISARIDATTSNLKELKDHGRNWGSYGANIRKAKKQVVDELERLKDEVQMKLDFVDGKENNDDNNNR